MIQNTPQKPLLRGHFHQAMFFISLGALVPLLLRTHNLKEFIAIFVYAMGALTLFGISALYHRINWKSSIKRSFWGKLDHSGIFLMIAGTVTPVALFGLSPESATTMIFVIWGVTVVGILQTFFFSDLPKLVNAAIFIIAGYLIVPYMGELRQTLGVGNLILIFLGGLSYTIGGLCYGLKWPRLSPKYFGYHELFHIFVNIGASLHFFAISSLIKG